MRALSNCRSGRVGWVVIGLVSSVGLQAPAPVSSFSRPASQRAAQLRVAETYGKLPLSFEECLEGSCGTAGGQVKFVSRSKARTVLLTSTEAVLTFAKPQANVRPSKAFETVLRIRPVGASPTPQMRGENELPGKSNYFIGNDPKKWRTNVPNYARVRYEDLYPGIDLVYYGDQGQLEYDFVVAPGADPGHIGLELSGADKITFDANGDLVTQQVRLHKPVMYQEAGGVRREVSGQYVLLAQNRFGFEVGAYDRGKPLVIDPVLSYATYIDSGDYGDFFSAGAIAVDAAGNIYLTGGRYVTGRDHEAVVAMLNPRGTAFVYSTYFGGKGYDSGSGIAVDASGNACVLGYTTSTDFPTVNPLQASFGGGDDDSFVVKLDPTGSTPLYSTYLGGGGDDVPRAIAVDASGNAYVTLYSPGPSFPTVNPVQGAMGTGLVAKLNATGSELVYATHFSGAVAIAADASGSAYVTGEAGPDLPTTRGAFQPASGGGSDAFVAKFSPAGALVYSTYLGGRFNESGSGIAVDGAGNVYVTGSTNSANFPTTNPLQPVIGGAPLYKTSNGGNSWSTSYPGLVAPSVIVLAVDPLNPSTLYAGTADSGVFKSTDGARSWRAANPGVPWPYSFAGPDIYQLVIDPKTPTTLYCVAEFSDAFKSTDGGNNWNHIDALLGVHSLAIDPTNPSTLYAATTRGAFKTSDGGSGWQPLTKVAPREYFDQVNILAVDPTTPTTLYAGVVSSISSRDILFKSTDGGKSWMALPAGVEGVTALVIDPKRPSTLYVGAQAGLTGVLLKSTDGGRSFTPINRGLAAPAANAMVINPNNSSILYLGLQGGVFRSTDGGSSWSPVDNGLPTAPSALAIDPANPAILYAGFELHSDAFVAKLNAAGSALVYSSYLGGVDWDSGSNIAVDATGNAFVAGSTSSSRDFPALKPLPAAFGASAGYLSSSGPFLAKLNPAGSALVYSTLMPSSAYAVALVADRSGATYVIQSSVGTLVAKIVDEMPAGLIVPTTGVGNAAFFRGPTVAKDANVAVAPGSIVSIFGANLADGTQAASAVPLPIRLLDTSVTFNGIAAPLFFVSPGQINAQVPYELPAGAAQIQVRRGPAVATVSTRIAEVAPGIFTIPGTLDGLIVHADDFRLVTPNARAGPGEFVVIFCTGLGPLRRPVPTGGIPPNPPPETVARPVVTIGGVPAVVTYSGAAPGFVGLYQVNTQVPAGLEAVATVQVTINGVPSNTVAMAVRF